VPKMISKRCELVKLCHINRSGPVLLRHTVYTRIVFAVMLSPIGLFYFAIHADYETTGKLHYRLKRDRVYLCIVKICSSSAGRLPHPIVCRHCD